ncbi:hypothetical protein GE115_06200, partial [Agromyces sp. CFH 90414]
AAGGTAADPASAAQPAAVAATAPLAPGAPKLTVKGSSLTITWTAPADGGSAVTGYKLALNGGTVVPVPATSTSYTFAKLGAGTYTATVLATNAVGDGVASPASTSARIAGAKAGSSPTDRVETTATATDAGAPGWLAGAGILVALVAVGGLALLGQQVLRRRRPATAPATASPEASAPDHGASPA